MFMYEKQEQLIESKVIFKRKIYIHFIYCSNENSKKRYNTLHFCKCYKHIVDLMGFMIFQKIV